MFQKGSQEDFSEEAILFLEGGESGQGGKEEAPQSLLPSENPAVQSGGCLQQGANLDRGAEGPICYRTDFVPVKARGKGSPSCCPAPALGALGTGGTAARAKERVWRGGLMVEPPNL